MTDNIYDVGLGEYEIKADYATFGFPASFLISLIDEIQVSLILRFPTHFYIVMSLNYLFYWFPGWQYWWCLLNMNAWYETFKTSKCNFNAWVKSDFLSTNIFFVKHLNVRKFLISYLTKIWKLHSGRKNTVEIWFWGIRLKVSFQSYFPSLCLKRFFFWFPNIILIFWYPISLKH